MRLYFEPADLEAMRAIREAWDRAARMNPGKMLPAR